MHKLITTDEDLNTFVRNFYEKQLHSNIVALFGELGSGKTTFVQAFGSYLGINEPIKSPTFLLLKQYPIPNNPRYTSLYHLDLYRIQGISDVEDLELPELWKDPKHLFVIEWADRIADILPENTQQVFFEYVSEQKREVIVNAN